MIFECCQSHNINIYPLIMGDYMAIRGLVVGLTLGIAMVCYDWGPPPS
jgi:hypothetical protein